MYVTENFSNKQAPVLFFKFVFQNTYNRKLSSVHTMQNLEDTTELRNLQDFRLKFFSQAIMNFLVDYIENCLTCLQAKPVKIETITPPLQLVASEQNFPDIVGQLPTSQNLKYMLTSIDVFSRYLFAIPMTNHGPETTAKALVSIFMRHLFAQSHSFWSGDSFCKQYNGRTSTTQTQIRNFKTRSNH